jgi:outer membrane lipoprotein-sorting protein
MRRIGLWIAVLTWCLAAPAWAEKSAAEILKTVDDQANQFTDFQCKMTFTTKTGDGPAKVSVLIAHQKGPKRMYHFTESGMAFLSLDPDTSYVYMPEDKKVRRVAAHSRNQTFMGTDYNADDMATTRYDEVFVPKLLATADAEWTLELTPKPGRESVYSKLVIHVDRERNVLNNLEYYNPKGELEKTEIRKDYKKFGNQWYCMTIDLANLKANHTTHVEMSDVKFDGGLPDDLFTQRQLKRLEQ